MNEKYKGPKFYQESDKDVFFGRENETKKLYYLVENSDFCVCYAESGEGKSSLINAGLSPMLRTNRYLPVRILFSDDIFANIFDKKSLDNIVWNALEEAIQKSNKLVNSRYNNITLYPLTAFDSKDKADDSLEWNFRNFELRGDSFDRIIPVIIFDQFEEVFTKASDIKWIDAFFNWLEELYGYSKLCSSSSDSQKCFKVLLSMRSDYISELDYWSMDKYFIPSLKNNRYCLKPLTLRGAEEVIKELYTEKIGNLSTKDFLEATKVEKAGVLDNNDFNLPCISALALSLTITCLENEKSGAQKFIKEFEENTSSASALFDKILEFYYNVAIKDSGLTKSEQAILESALVDNKGFRKRVLIDEANISNIDEVKLDRLEQKRIVHKSKKYIELSHDCLKRIIDANNQKREENRDNMLYASLATILFIFATFFSYKFLLFETTELANIYKYNCPTTFSELWNNIIIKHPWVLCGNISMVSTFILMPFLLFLKFRRKLFTSTSIISSLIILFSLGLTTFFVPNYTTFLPFTIATIIILGCIYFYSSTDFAKEKFVKCEPVKKFEISKWMNIEFNNAAIGLFVLIICILLRLNIEYDDYHILTYYYFVVLPIIFGCLGWVLLDKDAKLKFKSYRFWIYFLMLFSFLQTFKVWGLGISIQYISVCFLVLSLLFGFIHLDLSKRKLLIKSTVIIVHFILLWLSIGLITNIWNPFINLGNGRFLQTTGKCMEKKTDNTYGVYANNGDVIFETIAKDTIEDKVWGRTCWVIPCESNGYLFGNELNNSYNYLMPVKGEKGKIVISRLLNIFKDIWEVSKSKIETPEVLAAKSFISIMRCVATINKEKTIPENKIPSLKGLYNKQDSLLDSICREKINDYPSLIHLQELLSKQAYTVLMMDALKENRREDLVNTMSYLMLSYFGDLYIKNHLTININASVENAYKGNDKDSLTFSDTSFNFTNSMLVDNNIMSRDIFYRSSNVLAMGLISVQNMRYNKCILINSIEMQKKFIKDYTKIEDKSINGSEKKLKMVKEMKSKLDFHLNKLKQTRNNHTSKYVIDNARRLNAVLNKAYEARDLKFTSYIQYNLFYGLCISLPLDKDIYTVSLNVLKHDSVLHSQYKDIVVDLQNRMDEMLEDANIIDSLIKFDEKQLEFIKDYTKKNNIPIK